MCLRTGHGHTRDRSVIEDVRLELVARIAKQPTASVVVLEFVRIESPIDLLDGFRGHFFGHLELFDRPDYAPQRTHRVKYHGHGRQEQEHGPEYRVLSVRDDAEEHVHE